MPKLLNSTEPSRSWQHPRIIQHTKRLLTSFTHWTGRSLIPDTLPNPAQTLFMAPFVVVSHGLELDPIFNYGNQTALDLWQFDWDSFTTLASRNSAQAIDQNERDRLLSQAKRQGYISNYKGVRISSQGLRFSIEDVTIWDVFDEQQQLCAQAATFDRWQFLED